jgi:hypothetical protein
LSERWFYTHQKQTFGPVPLAEVRGLAAAGRLGLDDWVWPEGADSRQAVPARAVLGKPAGPLAPPAAPPPPPDWLEDVRKSEQAGGSGGLLGKSGVPDWLADVREAVPERPGRSGGEPGWLSDVRETEVPTLPLSALEEEPPIPRPSPPEPPPLPEPEEELLPVTRTQGPPEPSWWVWTLIPVGVLVVLTLLVWGAAELFHVIAKK